MADKQYKFRLVGEGRIIDYTASEDKAAGVPIQLAAGLVGITKRAIDYSENPLGTLALDGVYEGVKANVAFSVGDRVFYDPTGDPYGGTAGSGACKKVFVAGYYFLGYAIAAASSTAQTVTFAKTSVGVVGTQSIIDAIADPGNAGAIPVTASGRVPIVSAGAETRTLAAPSFAGQELLIYMKTDGGDCVITCATGINQTGNNTITMNDAGDVIRLHAIESGSNLRWRTVVNDGCTLSTV